MYRPRRVGRGTTSFPSDARSALVVCAWCAAYSASDGIRSEARTTVHRWSNWHRVWFAKKASIKEHTTNPFRRDPCLRWWCLRPIASCATRRPYYPQIRNASTPPSPSRPHNVHSLYVQRRSGSSSTSSRMIPAETKPGLPPRCVGARALTQSTTCHPH